MSNNNHHLIVGEIYVRNYFKGEYLFEECRKITRITKKAIHYIICGRDGVATDNIEYRANSAIVDYCSRTGKQTPEQNAKIAELYASFGFK